MRLEPLLIGQSGGGWGSRTIADQIIRSPRIKGPIDHTEAVRVRIRQDMAEPGVIWTLLRLSDHHRNSQRGDSGEHRRRRELAVGLLIRKKGPATLIHVPGCPDLLQG